MAGLCKLFAILSLSAAAWAFSPGAPANRLLAASGRAEGRPSCAAHRRARPGSGSLRLAMQQRMSDEEYLEIMKAGKAAPEGSEAWNAWKEEARLRVQENFDRSVQRDKDRQLVGPVQKFKEDNPEAFKVAQLVWLATVVATLAFPGAFVGMFGGQ